MAKEETSERRSPDQVMMPAFHREAAIDAASLNEEKRSFDIVWTAGAEVPRIDWWTGQRYIEVLEVNEKAIRMDRLESGRAPVLDSHSRWGLTSVIGVVEKGSIKIDKGQARATVRMSAREEIAGLVADIRGGIIANVSPGYITHSYREEMRDGKMYRIATDWEPIELSFVPVGADPDAGTMRSAGAGAGQQPETYPCVVTRAVDASPAVADNAVVLAAAARMRMRARSLSDAG